MGGGRWGGCHISDSDVRHVNANVPFVPRSTVHPTCGYVELLGSREIRVVRELLLLALDMCRRFEMLMCDARMHMEPFSFVLFSCFFLGVFYVLE